MTKSVRVLLSLLSAVFFCTFLPGSSQATTLSVNCNGSPGEDSLTTIGGALRLLNPEGPNTLNVSGSCHENIVIQSFGRLTLNAVNGASISDASGGNNTVVVIVDSTAVMLRGFRINGGNGGISCEDFSQCRFQNNTIQAGGDGVFVGSQSRASFDGDVIQNNAGRGLAVANGSYVRAVNVSVNNNSEAGIFVGFGSTVVGNPVIIQKNANGVRVIDHSTFRLNAGTITANFANGVSLEGASEASLMTDPSFGGPITISGNSGNGVQINDLSFARFQNGGPSLSVTGNAAALDVACNPQFSATRGALTDAGGARTNCVEP